MPINISGETRIPNWMLGLFILGLTSGWGIIGGVIIQDRGRVHVHGAEIGDAKERLARLEKDASNLMSMWNTVNRKMDEFDRKLERLMP